MRRSELIQAVHSLNPHLSLQQIERTVVHIFDKLTKTLQHGGRAELRGFGVFTTRIRSARLGRNPRTGENVTVSRKVVPFFKAGKELRNRINNFRRIANIN